MGRRTFFTSQSAPVQKFLSLHQEDGAQAGEAYLNAAAALWHPDALDALSKGKEFTLNDIHNPSKDDRSPWRSHETASIPHPANASATPVPHGVGAFQWGGPVIATEQAKRTK